MSCGGSAETALGCDGPEKIQIVPIQHHYLQIICFRRIEHQFGVFGCRFSHNRAANRRIFLFLFIATISANLNIVTLATMRVWQLTGLNSFLEISFHELALFAGIGIFLGSIAEISLDIVALTVWFLLRRAVRQPKKAVSPQPLIDQGSFAVFVPAWREADVIGQMLDAAMASYEGDDVHLFVGCYPNDPDTGFDCAQPRGPQGYIGAG
ncbi:MAG: glycosyltransferase [Sphingomonadales bacterium]|nr:glycosyltransferase [Sphingomonadales bacterium]